MFFRVLAKLRQGKALSWGHEYLRTGSMEDRRNEDFIDTLSNILRHSLISALPRELFIAALAFLPPILTCCSLGIFTTSAAENKIHDDLVNQCDELMVELSQL